ncbi:MAG TPA: GNAT family N-acetyltransferase, partial [Fibrobacteria bacterium]|nr:GNAT family N-acetyltransferase [Fibrobacteria bacterium]
LDLREVDPANPMAGWKVDQRWRARAAARDGLVVREGKSAEDWDAYVALYAKSLTRWGDTASSRHPEGLFHDLRETLPEGAVKLWLAEHDGRAGAGFITFYHNRHAALWHGAADEEFFGAGANQLLYLAMSEDARARGFSWLDLLPSGGHKGVEAFKARFGSRRLEFDSSLNRTGLVGALAEVRARLRGRP